MTPLWFWEQPTGLVRSGITYYHNLIWTAETGLYFDGQLVGTGSIVNEPIYDAGEFVIAFKDKP